MHRSALAAALFSLLIVSLAGAGFAPAPEWNPKSFPISFWCGPPDGFITVERYREVAAAGFNYLMPPCEGPSLPERNHRILDTAKAAGLKAFLQDQRMPDAITGVPDAKQRLETIIRDYAKHPAFAGYFLWDEPSASRFAGLGEVVAYLREHDPTHPAYINLYPNYASPDQLGEANYDAYVERYVRTVKPFTISYDHYHFLTTGDRPGFFANLQNVRDLAQKYELPFWQIVLAVPHGSYRPLTEAEKRWEAMQTLAYGGKGVLYFTYWTPNDPSFQWGNAIIRHDGTPTKQYDEVNRINADVQAIGKYLLYGVPGSVFENGDIPPGGRPREPGTPVVFPGAGDVTTGLFRGDTHLYALFANRDYKNPTATDVVLQAGGNPVEHLMKSTGKWDKVKGEKTADGDLKVRLNIAAGDGELYRW